MARKQKQFHYIYKTTNLKNNKYYIGMHSTDNLEDGYMGSGKRLRRSLRKYGKENFKFEILEFLFDRKLLIKKEKELINEELLTDSLSMNIKGGGEGGFVNDEHRMKFIVEGTKKGREKANDILRLKYGGGDDWLSKFNSYVSKKAWSDPSYREKGLERLKNLNLKWKGEYHTEESKKKIGEKNSIRQSGSGNSQFGTCWITNGKENKKIHKGDLIPNGWKLGRYYLTH